MKSVTRPSFTRCAQVLGRRDIGKTFSSVLLFPFKSHLCLPKTNIFIMVEIKDLLKLWQLGVMNDAADLTPMS